MLKDQLATLTKEFTTLKAKIQTKLTQKDRQIKQQEQTITQTQQQKQEAVNKLEIAFQENSANEQVLAQLIKEFQELTKQLN